MKILFDTSALITLLISSEVMHKKLVRFLQQIEIKKAKFYVTDYILDELFTRLLYAGGAHVAQTGLRLVDNQLQNGSLQLIHIGADGFDKAKRIFIKYADQKLSFTDITTFLIYKNYNIDEICSLDGDFQKIGAKVSKI